MHARTRDALARNLYIPLILGPMADRPHVTGYHFKVPQREDRHCGENPTFCIFINRYRCMAVGLREGGRGPRERGGDGRRERGRGGRIDGARKVGGREEEGIEWWVKGGPKEDEEKEREKDKGREKEGSRQRERQRGRDADIGRVGGRERERGREEGEREGGVEPRGPGDHIGSCRARGLS